MSNMVLLKSARFENVDCDFYEEENEIWMTREQIGTALAYENPREAIKLIHKRHKERLDQHSRGFQIETPRGGRQVTVIYSARGVYEICRWSKQPKADQFYDFVYDILEGLRTGQLVLREKDSNLRASKRLLEIKERNSRVRQANILLKTADKYKAILSGESINLLISLATETAMGRPVLPRPEVVKTYTASELGRELGVSSNRIGRVANQLGIKTSEYGIYVLDKSPYSDKQVESFRYNDKGRAAIMAAIKVTV
jgi:prophage antirepressor-like protein